MTPSVTSLALLTVFFSLQPLGAQNVGPTSYSTMEFINQQQGGRVYDLFAYSITRAPDGTKTFKFVVRHCVEGGVVFFAGNLLINSPGQVICVDDSSAVALSYAPVQEAIGDFLSDNSDAPHKIQYAQNPFSAPLHAALSTVQPAASPDPYMIFLDGLGNSAVQFDLATQTVVAQITIPNSALGPVAIRPTASPPSNEVWVANSGLQVSILDFAAQTVAANISTPTLPVAVSVVGLAFTNDGSTALEALAYNSPDSSGNSGALVVFDAVKRSLTSTLPFKNAPSAFVMAPDALSAYLLNNAGQITYYDVLSKTADLTTSTYTPGMAGGYPGGSVFIHPDGTRLFWDVGGQLAVFDLPSHRVVNLFPSGLPTTSATSMQMAADGNTVSISNGAGATALMDTHYGSVITTYQDNGATQVFLGPGH